MSILDDSVYYFEAYNQFVLRHDKINTMKEVTELVFVQDGVEKMETKDTNIRMLGIGSNSGRIELLFIRQLLNRFPKIENTVVEPNAEAIAEYQNSVQGKWDNVGFSWFNGTFQKFREQLELAGNDQKFHHISLVDSIYFADNLNEDILFLYNRLEEGGIMFILVDSDESLMYKIQERYPRSESKLVSSTRIVDVCKTNKFPYHLHHQECYGDITGLFSSSNITRNEKMLLDFWIQIKDFKDNVPESLYEEVIAFVKSPACSKNTEGKLMFHDGVDMVFIKKEILK